MTILRNIADVVAFVAGFIFALGAICGAGAILIAVGLFHRWDKGERKYVRN